MTQSNTAIFESHVKGLRWRDLLVIISCTITIVSTGVGVYYSIKADIKNLSKDKESDNRYNNLRLETLEANQKALQIMIEKLDNKISIIADIKRP